MNGRPFSIGEAIKSGWEYTKEHIWFLVGYQIILYILVAIFSGSDDWRWAIVHLFGWALIALAKMGLYNSTLIITANYKPGFDQLYTNWRLFFSWVIANFLFGIMFFIGLALLIIPGLYILARFGLFPYFILDRNLGPIEALKQTSQATKGIRWQMFLLFLAVIGLNILGFLFFVIGLLVTVPITLLALATVYRKLTNREISVDQGIILS